MQRQKRMKKLEEMGFFLSTGAPSPMFEDLVLMLKLDLWMGDEKNFEKRLRQAFDANTSQTRIALNKKPTTRIPAVTMPK